MIEMVDVQATDYQIRPLISVIVPVFNVEDYLHACVDSILKSTFRDFELILVNDGSTDSSDLICDQYARQDKRVSVIHQKNKGISPARNAGLEISKGDFVLMIDGDDCIHSQMIETLYSLITSGDYDFAMCSFKRINSIDEAIDDSVILKDDDHCILTPHDCMYRLFVKSNFEYNVVWNKLYSRDTIAGLFFNNDACQDVEYNSKVFRRSKKAIYTSKPLYYYVCRPGSFQNRPMNRRQVDTILTFDACLDDIPADNSLYRSYCLRHIYRRMLLKNYDASRTEHQSYAYDVVNRIRKKTIKEFYSNKDIPFIEKHALAFFSNHLKMNNVLWDTWVALNKCLKPFR